MKQHRLFTNAAYLTLPGYLLLPLTIFSSILIRRWLDPYAYGIIATLNLLVLYSSFSNLGTLNAAEVSLPYYRGKGDLAKFDNIKATAFSFNLITSATFSLFVAAWAVYTQSQIDKYLFIGLLVYCIYSFLNQIVTYYITVLKSTREFIFLGKYIFATGLLNSLGNILAVWLFGYIGFLAVAIIIVLIQLIILSNQMNCRTRFRINRVDVRKIVLSGLPLFLIGLLSQGMRTIDNFLVLKLLDIEKLGQYSIALMASTIVFSFTTSISTVLYPSMQEAYGKSGATDSMRSYVTTPSLIIAQLLPVMIGGMYFMVPIIVHWLIPKYELGITPFKIIVTSTCFFAMTNMFIGYLISMQKQRSIIAINIGILLLIGGLAELLTFYKCGLEGIALSTGIGYFVYFVVVAIYTLRHWASWTQTMVFLNNTSLPIFFSFVLIYLVDQYFRFGSANDNMKYTLPFLQMSLFFVLYIPCIFLYDRRARIYSDLFTHLFRRK